MASPLLNESRTSVWSVLNDPYHQAAHIQDQEDTEEGLRFGRGTSRQSRTPKKMQG